MVPLIRVEAELSSLFPPVEGDFHTQCQALDRKVEGMSAIEDGLDDIRSEESKA